MAFSSLPLGNRMCWEKGKGAWWDVCTSNLSCRLHLSLGFCVSFRPWGNSYREWWSGKLYLQIDSNDLSLVCSCRIGQQVFVSMEGFHCRWSPCLCFPQIPPYCNNPFLLLSVVGGMRSWSFFLLREQQLLLSFLWLFGISNWEAGGIYILDQTPQPNLQYL